MSRYRCLSGVGDTLEAGATPAGDIFIETRESGKTSSIYLSATDARKLAADLLHLAETNTDQQPQATQGT